MAETSEIHVGIGSCGDTYEIDGLLGRGGMGAVCGASHCACRARASRSRVLHGREAATRDVRAFRREAEIASRLGHPNIVAVHDFNTLPDGTPYIVLEYLEGETSASG